MNAVLDRPLRVVAIIDDKQDQAETTGALVEDAGYEPRILSCPFPDPGDLVRRVKEAADAAICDHRLRPGGCAPFNGAEAAARLYREKVPTILQTLYLPMDGDVSIREYRREIPALLAKADADPERIREMLEFSRREIEGEVLPGRRPRRTLVRIEEIAREAGEEVVDAVVPGWNPRQAVRFPTKLILRDVAVDLRPGQRFFAMVNVGAECEEALFFYGFEMASDPDAADGLA